VSDQPGPEPDPRIVLVETSAALPGLLPVTAWQSLSECALVVTASPPEHPSVVHLAMGGIDVAAMTEAKAETRGMDLMSAGGASPRQRRLAQGLIETAVEHGSVACLLEPGDTRFGLAVGMEAARVGGLEVEFAFLMGVPEGLEVLRLAQIMARLRDPVDGCPWDLEQDHQTLTSHLIEEAYELLDAIEREDDADILEELGDVLLQVVFHAQVGRDRGAFGLDEIATGIADKLVRRHPHVFGDATAETADQVQKNWDELKAEEKGHRTGPFDGVPIAMPSLQLAQAYQRKAAKQGFDWQDADGPLAKIHEELAELAAATDDEARAEEVGDLLGAVVGLARTLGVDAEQAMRLGAAKFRGRYETILARAERQKLDLAALTPGQWVALWDKAKAFD
jgi:MazG family protein